MEHKINNKNVSRETLDYVSALLDGYESKLSQYAELLLWWNQKVNLLSRTTTKEDVEKHIIHSLFLSIAALFPKQEFLVDIGTGGGLPGISLAICFPDKEFILLDRVSKKTTACHDISRQLGLQNIGVCCQELKKFHVEHEVAWISKHAIKLNDLMHSTVKQKWELAFMLKGTDFTDELKEVKEPVKIITYAIDSAMNDPFYSGKRVLQLKKDKTNES